MFCSKCGVELPEIAVVCYKCATKTRKGELLDDAENKPVTKSGISTPVKAITGFLAMFGLVFVGVVGLVILFNLDFIQDKIFNSKSSSSTSPSQSEKINIDVSKPDPIRTYEKPTPMESLKQVLIDDSFFVGARTLKDISFTLTKDSTLLTGRFSAQGGQNDINCIIVDDDNYPNITNGTAGRSYYNSDYTSSGKVDIRLAPGKYHIIFDNRKALLTNKTVTAKFEAE